MVPDEENRQPSLTLPAAWAGRTIAGMASVAAAVASTLRRVGWAILSPGCKSAELLDASRS